MKQFALTLALLGSLGFSGMIVGCEDKGPAEQTGQDAGRAVDDAMEKAGDALDDLSNN